MFSLLFNADFVVGAPYEGEDPCRMDEDTNKAPCSTPKPYPQGAVYLFHGSPSGIVGKYAQVTMFPQVVS